LTRSKTANYTGALAEVSTVLTGWGRRAGRGNLPSALQGAASDGASRIARRSYL